MTKAERVREILDAAVQAPREELIPILGEIGRAAEMIRGRLSEPIGRDDDELLPVEAAAKLMHLGASTLYRQRDRLPFAVKVAGRVRFSRNGIRRWLEAKGAA